MAVVEREAIGQERSPLVVDVAGDCHLVTSSGSGYALPHYPACLAKWCTKPHTKEGMNKRVPAVTPSGDRLWVYLRPLVSTPKADDGRLYETLYSHYQNDERYLVIAIHENWRLFADWGIGPDRQSLLHLESDEYNHTPEEIIRRIDVALAELNRSFEQARRVGLRG